MASDAAVGGILAKLALEHLLLHLLLLGVGTLTPAGRGVALGPLERLALGLLGLGLLLASSCLSLGLSSSCLCLSLSLSLQL